MLREYDYTAMGIGYTIGSGLLYCEFPVFHRYAESLLNRSILTHEFGFPALWEELRTALEAKLTELRR